ncbi:dipeptidase [Cohnella nanjingensis]|uniref:Membrane dipeptidase n=1 Tax=Cohnella nanjingensis TaxID=1387779 RepID=A0A7X0VHN1_9BACL|nr:membrane dipeptidase [Cohnella nanjingensis]MBB6672834.1 membrane dipeptidase [Cohnella nanjingensis]
MRQVADLHCDVLSKMLRDDKVTLGPPNDGKLDVTLGRLRQGGIGLQVFAMWVPDELAKTPETLLRAAELFWSKVLTCEGMRLVRKPADVESVLSGTDPGLTGALLSLEGVNALQGQWWALRLLHRLGLRLLGPTWNHANWACDGVGEPRGGGLTKAGRQLVAECEKLGILIDVSHLSDRGFWDLADAASRPFFASHSNSRRLCDNPRNLTDDQIRALIAVDGLVGLTFVPYFVTVPGPATIDDVLRQVEHVCGLGGERHIAFGSDFDGIEVHVQGLSHPGEYPALAEALIRRYPEAWVKGWLSGNVRRFLTTNLRE